MQLIHCKELVFPSPFVSHSLIATFVSTSLLFIEKMYSTMLVVEIVIEIGVLDVLAVHRKEYLSGPPQCKTLVLPEVLQPIH